MSNSRKFLFYFSLMAVVVGAGVIGYFVQKNYYAAMQDRLLNDFFAPTQKIQAQFIAAQFEEQVNNILSVLKTTATRTELHKINNSCTSAQKAIIEQTLVALNGVSDYVGLIDAGGVVRCMADLPEMTNVSIADYPHIKEALATHQAVVSRAIVNPLGIKLIFIGVPIFNESGKFVGLLSGPVRMDSLNQQLNASTAPTPSAYNIMIDDDGVMILHPRAEFAMQNIFGDVNQKAINFDPATNGVFHKMLQGESGYAFYSFAGDRKVVGYAPARIYNGNRFLIIAVTARVAEYAAPSEEYQLKVFLAGLAVIFGASLLIFTIFYLRDKFTRK